MLKTISWCAKNTGGENSNSSIMVVHFKQAGKRIATHAFTLIEVLIAVVILTLIMGGVLYGYVEANRIAEWSSQSLAAMSYAEQGMERLRAAQWCAEEFSLAMGQGNTDVLGDNFQTNEVDTLDVPTTGSLIYVTNTITATAVLNADGKSIPPLKRLVSQVVWTFTLTGQLYTNTIVTLRAPDQLQ
jgi:prepilin-type N-terminal cleavage/methylation domain-containing protein